MFLEYEANVVVSEIGESLFVHGEGVISVEKDRPIAGCVERTEYM